MDYAYAVWRQARAACSTARPERFADTRLPAGAAERSPVLLLPGVYENWRFLLPLAEHLHDLGHPVHPVPTLGYNTRTVLESSTLASAYLEAAGLNDVVIVAHSKGGLIGKTLMLGEQRHRVAKMIAIAAPFSGSAWARFAVTPRLRDFSPRNAHTLLLGSETGVDARITSIYPDFDPHIPAGSRLPGAKNIRLDTIGHFRILHGAALREALREALGD